MGALVLDSDLWTRRAGGRAAQSTVNKNSDVVEGE